MAQLMNAKDAVWAGMGSVYVTVDGNRYCLIQTVKISTKYKKDKKKVPIMGTTVAGNKAGGLSYSGTMSYYYNTSLFRKYLKRYQDSGEDLYFDIVITNEDKTAACGKQTVILKNCNFDDGTVAELEAGGDVLVDESNFTFEKFEMPDEFTELDGMKG